MLFDDDQRGDDGQTRHDDEGHHSDANAYGNLRGGGARTGTHTMKCWQLNIASFPLRGSEFIQAAEEHEVDIILLQETRRTSQEAEIAGCHTRGWDYHHVEA